MRGMDRDLEHPEKQPGGTDRQEYRGRERSYSLCDSELQTLRTVGTFRTVNAKDLPNPR